MKRLSQTDQNNTGIVNLDSSASNKGLVQLTGDLGGTATSPEVKPRIVTATVGATTGTHPVSSYANAAAALQAAATAAAGGRMLVQKGTYSITASTTVPSGTHVDHEDGVILQATGSFSNGIYNIDAASSTHENTVIENATLDCNNQTNVQGISIKGGTYSAGAYAKKIRLRRLTLKNETTTSVGLITIYSGRGSTDRGPVTDLIIDDCVFDTTSKNHIFISGGQVEDLKILRSTFRNSQYGCIAFDQQTKDDNANAAARSCKNWEIAQCKFIDNQLSNTPLSGFTAVLTDSNKSGIRGLKFHHNWCEGQNSTAPEQYILSINSSWDVQVHNNTFWKVRSVFNIGQSNNGPWYQNDGSQMVSIKDNVFFRCYNIVDHDSDFFGEWSGNKFIEIEYAGLGGYSRQWPMKIHDNYFYNTPTDDTGSNERRSAIALIANGSEVYSNTVIDDRLLPDPTTAPVLTQIAGGSLGARTYYVKYTWKNDTGETVGSSEASLAVSANNLLHVTHPYTTTYGPPTGAKYVNIYVSTTSGSYTTGLQASVPTAWQQEYQDVRTNTFGPVDWYEPTGGLVTGTALPGSNTTNTVTLYGIYEVSGGSGPLYPNHYHHNTFYGFSPAIYKQSNYLRVSRDNVIVPDLTTNIAYSVERAPYDIGNVTTTATVDPVNGDFQKMTLGGNTSITLQSGLYVGQQITVEFIQDATGSRTPSFGGNFKSAGGGLTFSTGANAIDMVVMSWDGTYWVEISRAQNSANASLPQGLSTSDSPTFAGMTLNGDLNFGAAATRNILMGRVTSGSANDFVVQAGGALSGATNNNAGNLYLQSGIATGSGAGSVYIATSGSGSSGTADKTPSVKMNVSGSQNGRLAIGTGTTTGTVDGITIGGSNARSVILTRHSTANTAGSSLTIQSGGATSGATNKNAGDFVLQTGLSTGTGTGTIKLQTPTPGSTGTSDNSLADRVTVSDAAMTLADALNVVVGTTTGTKIGTATSQKIGFFNSTPIIQPSGNALTALTNLGLIASPTLTSSNVGLGNVDNTSDATKNSATATLTNKTLTAPSLGSAGFIADANGNEVIKTAATVTSAVNELSVTNAATGNPVILEATGNDSDIHLVARAKGNGLTKVSILRQDNTTNSYKHNSVILTGWGVFAQAAVSKKTETVTFGITFAAIPIVMISYGGDQTGGTVALGNGGDNEKGPVCVKAYAETTGAFTAFAQPTDATSWSATANVYYKWVAIGEL